MGTIDESTPLFALPSFLSGAARVFDLGGAYTSYNRSPSPQEADARALAADWMAVAGDMREAVRSVVNQPKR